MDKKKKSLTPRIERRLKWYQEQKSGARVTRAKTGTKADSSPNSSNSEVKTEVSNRGFKSKILPSKQNAKKSASNNTAKKLHTSKSMNKKTGVPDNQVAAPQYPDVNVDHKDGSSSDASSSDKMGKAKKKPFVDAVEKLENTTSVHIPKRYILFVGNLPKDITKEQVEEHFKKTGGVKTVRIPKHKGSEESRGFAYVEFNSTISHRIALRLHNTTLGGRKINVEFTSEGKKTPKRMESLRQKNEKLAKYKMPFDT